MSATSSAGEAKRLGNRVDTMHVQSLNLRYSFEDEEF